jgi:hypothetical protein
MTARRFPPPWSIDELEGIVVIDGAGQKLAYVYFEDEPSASPSNKTGWCERATGHSASA